MADGRRRSVWERQDDWRFRWRRASANEKLRWLEEINWFIYRVASRRVKRLHRFLSEVHSRAS